MADHGPKSLSRVDLQIGSRIRARRVSLGLSQEKLGQLLGVTFQQVQKYELGANRCSASRLVAMATILETTVAELVGETRNQIDPEIAALDAEGLRLVEIYKAAPPAVRRVILATAAACRNLS